MDKIIFDAITGKTTITKVADEEVIMPIIGIPTPTIEEIKSDLEDIQSKIDILEGN